MMFHMRQAARARREDARGRPSATGDDAGHVPRPGRRWPEPTGLEESIDDQLEQSFPASDPPSWVQGTSPVPD